LTLAIEALKFVIIVIISPRAGVRDETAAGLAATLHPSAHLLRLSEAVVIVSGAHQGLSLLVLGLLRLFLKGRNRRARAVS
jgi:hypothetical protein